MYVKQIKTVCNVHRKFWETLFQKFGQPAVVSQRDAKLVIRNAKDDWAFDAAMLAKAGKHSQYEQMCKSKLVCKIYKCFFPVNYYLCVFRQIDGGEKVC